MTDTSPLRLAPMPEAEQVLFPWTAKDPHRLLALAPSDVERFRGKFSILAPGYFQIPAELTSDGRWHEFLRHKDAPALCGPLVFILGELAIRRVNDGEIPGIGRPMEDLPAIVRMRWGFAESAMPLFYEATRAGLAAGLLVEVDASTQAWQSSYKRVKRPPSKRREDSAAAHDCRQPRTTAAAAVDGYIRTDRLTDRQNSNDDDGRREARREKSNDNANDDDADNLLVDGIRISTWNTTAAYVAVRTLCWHWRKQAAQQPWPANTHDKKDLDWAIRLAIRDKSVPALVELLRETCGWAESGGGFHKALKEAGWIR